MRHRLSPLILIVLLIVAASPLITVSAAETTVIGLSVPSLDDPFYEGLQKGAVAAARDLAIEVKIAEAVNDPAVELKNIEALIAQGVAAIVIAPVDPVESAAAVALANEAGIPVLLVTGDTPVAIEGDVVASVVPNDRQGGWLAASLLCEALDASGTVLALTADTPSALARSDGFTRYMAENCADVTLLPYDVTGQTRAGLVDPLADFLRDQPIDGVFAYDDQMTLAAIEASIVARRGGITFVGYEASDDAIAALQQGRLQAVVTPVGWALGAIAIDAANAYVNGTDIPAEILVDLGVLDIDSLTLFRGPGSGHTRGDPRSGSFEGGPGSGAFEGGPGSGAFEGGPGSGSFEGGPGSANFEGGPGSGSFEGGPGSGRFEGGPGSGSFE